MVFKARKDNGGALDKNINKFGRPLKGDEKTLTRREAKDKELLSLARKWKPHVSTAMKEVIRILENENASESNKLKAAAFWVKTYQDLMNEIYAASRGDEPSEEQTGVIEVQPDNRPVFSLRMINTEELSKD